VLDVLRRHLRQVLPAPHNRSSRANLLRRTEGAAPRNILHVRRIDLRETQFEAPMFDSSPAYMHGLCFGLPIRGRLAVRRPETEKKQHVG